MKKNNALPYILDKETGDFLAGKSEQTLQLFHAFLQQFSKVGPISLHAAKTMIGISNGTHRIAWITQLGRNFVHIVFPFTIPYPDNLCFQKIAQVPGSEQYNHHLRIFHTADINEEVQQFMKKAYKG